jgi:hypothetical protein
MMRKKYLLHKCIEEMQSGYSNLEECISKYPNLSKELGKFDNFIGNDKPRVVIPSIEFKQRVRLKLVEAMSAPNEAKPQLNVFRAFISYEINIRNILLVLVVAGSLDPAITFLHKNDNFICAVLLYFQNEKSFSFLLRRMLSPCISAFGNKGTGVVSQVT